MSGGDSVDLLDVFPEHLITGAEAAEIAGVSEATVRQWATRHKIRRFPGRCRSEATLYVRPEVEAEAVRVAELKARAQRRSEQFVALAA